MKRFLVMIPLFLLGLSAFAYDEPKKEDVKALDGTWMPESGELAGEKFPDEVLKTIKLVIKDGSYTLTLGTKVDKGTLKVDASAKTKTMDITGTEGPNKDKTFQCIYELKDDTMKVCYDLEGKKRPTEFKTSKDTKQFMVTYKKKKE